MVMAEIINKMMKMIKKKYKMVYLFLQM